MKSIAIFNNKGGVGKTTLLCNMVSLLAERGSRVLLIDADPQCNATIYLFSEDKIEELYSDKSTKTIYNLVQPITRGGSISNAELPIIHSDGFNVDVIIGDTKLAISEDVFSKEWMDLNTDLYVRSLNNTFFLKSIFQRLEGLYDYVFFDMGPSLGSLNRLILLSCDYFVIPMSSDIFSLKAIENIGTSLEKWTKTINNTICRYKEDNDDEPYYVGDVNRRHELIVDPIFLGYISQQYNAKTKGGVKQPVLAYDRIIKRMPDKIKSQLRDFHSQAEDCPGICLGSIPTMNSLIPLSQVASKPIYSLTGIDNVVGAHFKKVQDARIVFDNIVNNLLNTIQYYDTVAREID